MALEDTTDGIIAPPSPAIDRTDDDSRRVDGRLDSQKSANSTVVISQIATRVQIFSQQYASSFEGMYQHTLLHDIQRIAQTLEARQELPGDIEAATQCVMRELAYFYLHQVSPLYVRGDMYSALMYLAISHDFFEQTKRELPGKFHFFFEQIEARMIPDSPLERLYVTLKNLLSDRDSLPVAQENDALDLSEGLFPECTLPELVKLAAAAKSRDDWRAVLEYQHAIVAREASNRIPTQGMFHLAKVYAKLGDTERALEILEDFKTKPFTTDDGVQSANAFIAQLKSHSLAQNKETVVVWPDRYEEVTTSDYTQCPSPVLFRYSKQAQNNKDHRAVILFQVAITQRPENIYRAVGYVVLSKAHTALGQLDDALRVSKICVRCPDYYPQSQGFDPVEYLTVLIRRRDRSRSEASRAPEKVASVPAVGRIERLLAQSRPAVDAVMAVPPVSSQKRAVVEAPLASPLIDASQFQLFFQSFSTHAPSWQKDSVRGEGWYKVPDLEKRVALDYLGASAKWVWQRILKGTPGGDTILRAIDAFEKHIQRGSIQLSVLADFQDRYAKLPEDVQVRLVEEVKLAR